MTSDAEYIARYTPDRLFLNPDPEGKGVYASMARESEVVLGEIDVTERFKIGVSAFYVKDQQDFGTYKITKLKWQKKTGWFEESSTRINYFHIRQIREFNAIIDALDLRDVQKDRIDFGSINLPSLLALLHSNEGAQVLRELSESPGLDYDIFALARKREAIAKFRQMLAEDTAEPCWQSFFEKNPWIFGHGLNYVFLDKVGAKLEAVTTGSDFSQPGKRADALMRTRAEASQFVLIEIKRNRTDLLRSTPYRTGCWSITDEVAGAIAQTQKTVHEFSKRRFQQQLKDELGNDLRQVVYSIDPKSYLIVGSLSELRRNDDKIACFELFRRNTRAPEILTFDELFYRAESMVEHLSREQIG